MKNPQPIKPIRNSSFRKDYNSTSDLSPNGLRGKIYLALFLLVLLAAIGLKIYKGHTAGILYDEETTYEFYGQNVKNALYTYSQPVAHNNHVINSLLIVLMNKYFRGYEHFIRIPSITSGVLLVLTLGLIVWQLVRSPVLRIILLAAVILNAFVFDLSFLARGYSHALAAFYLGMALIIYLMRHQIKFKYSPVIIGLMVLVNFVAFGSMLSSLWPLLSLNLLFAFGYSSSIYRNPPKRPYNILLHGLAIAALSSAALFALYHGIYRQIIDSRFAFNLMPYGMGELIDCTTLPFSIFTKWLLWDNLAGPPGGLYPIAFYTLIGALTAALLLFAAQVLQRAVCKGPAKAFNLATPQGFVVLVTALYVLSLFITHNLFGMSIGMPRNAVFLLPLVLLLIGMLFDQLLLAWPSRLWRICAGVIVSLVLALVVWQNLPDPTVVQRESDWHLQSMSRPLLHRMKEIDPARKWRILLTPTTINFWVGAIYYERRDYNFRFVQGEDYDVLIYYKTENLPDSAIFLDRDYFLRFNCFVLVNPQLARQGIFPQNRLTISQADG